MKWNLKFEFLYDVNNSVLLCILVLLFEKDFFKFYLNKFLLLLRLTKTSDLFSDRNLTTILNFKVFLKECFKF